MDQQSGNGFGGSIDLAWDFYECADAAPLIDAEGSAAQIVAAITAAGLTYVASSVHSFGESEGFSFVAIIGESHVAMHTWPEKSALELTIHYCNYSQNNDEKAAALQEKLVELFAPGRVVTYDRRVRCLEAAG